MQNEIGQHLDGDIADTDQNRSPSGKKPLKRINKSLKRSVVLDEDEIQEKLQMGI